MINVEPFKAKLVSEPEVRETKRGPVCNMRVRQVDPGKSSVFIDIAVFAEDLVARCRDLASGALIDVSGAGLIYSQWESPARGKGKAQKRSKHSLIAESIAVGE
jgi:single-stranded DNA-binding protein